MNIAHTRTIALASVIFLAGSSNSSGTAQEPGEVTSSGNLRESRLPAFQADNGGPVPALSSPQPSEIHGSSAAHSGIHSHSEIPPVGGERIDNSAINAPLSQKVSDRAKEPASDWLIDGIRVIGRAISSGNAILEWFPAIVTLTAGCCTGWIARGAYRTHLASLNSRENRLVLDTPREQTQRKKSGSFVVVTRSAEDRPE